MAPTSNRPLCNEVQQQASQICVTSARLPVLGSQCTQPAMGGSGPICLPASSHSEHSVVVEKLQDYPCRRIILIAPGWSNIPLFWDLMIMSSQIPLSLPNLLTQSDSTHESVKPKSTCVAPRGSAIKEQRFSEAEAAQIEAPQRGSTR